MAQPKAAAQNWARGYKLAYLQHIANLFRSAYGPYAFSQFALPNEAEVARALSEGELHQVGPQFAPTAVAIVKRLRLPSKRTDFTGTQVFMQKHALRVSAFAPVYGRATHELFELIKSKTLGWPLWVEAFEESKPATMLAMFGLTWRGTRVGAASELKGFYSNQAWPEFNMYSAAESATLGICRQQFLSGAEVRGIFEECHAYGEWAQHYSSYNKRRSWQAFALCGYDAKDPQFIIKPSEMSRSWRDENPQRLKATCAPTSAAQYFPIAMQALAKLPGRPERVRMMRLTPSGELSRHADITNVDAGTAPGKLVRFHIPIVTPPECQFTAWDARGNRLQLHMPRGALCYLDQRKPHMVQNPGGAERIHFVVDVYSDEKVRAYVEQAYYAQQHR